MIDVDSFFSDSYEIALSRFLEAGAGVGATHVQVPLGDGFNHDYLWFGSLNPKKAVVHIAGTHGVEGFVGAAIQLAALSRASEIQNFCCSGDSALVFLLALNPWGFKNLRRVNSNNVDLNRNFLDPWDPPTASPEYIKLYDWVNPKGSTSAFSYYATAIALILRYGIPTLKQAFAGGQATFPKGIYYCGDKPQVETIKFTEFLEQRFEGAERLNIIEVHSGLGSFAQNTVFSFGHDDKERQRLSQELDTALVDDCPAGVGIKTTGDIARWFESRFNRRGCNWYLQEFGTFHPIRVLKALRDENAEFHLGHRSPAVKQQLMDAFCPVGAWRSKVLDHGLRFLKNVLKS
jgi:hypothetical protein